MTYDVAVFDATPLIAFHQIGQLELVRRLFGHTLAPTIVANEVRPSFGALPPWIDVREIGEMPAFWRKLDAGERLSLWRCKFQPISSFWTTLRADSWPRSLV